VGRTEVTQNVKKKSNFVPKKAITMILTKIKEKGEGIRGDEGGTGIYKKL